MFVFVTDVQKEAGLILAARFCLFTQNIKEAQRISEKLLGAKQSSGASTAFEMEAICIQQWCTIAEIELLGNMDSSSRQQLFEINDLYNSNRNTEQLEPDSLMVWAKSRYLLEKFNDVFNIYNQVNS